MNVVSAEESDKYVNRTVVYNSDGTIWDASKKQYADGKLYINGKLIESDAPVKFLLADDGVTVVGACFPFRTIMEGLGATVVWVEETENILIEYDRYYFIDYYIAFIECLTEPSDYPQNYKFYITNYKTGEEFKLSPMGGDGGYLEVNDRIYLFQYSGEYLLQELGCQYEIDKEAKTIWITTE